MGLPLFLSFGFGCWIYYWVYHLPRISIVMRVLTGPKILTMLEAAGQIVYLPEGGVEVMKATVVGVGKTLEEALVDWSITFSAMIARPPGVTTDFQLR
jgi:hypothetical protein